MNSIITSDSFIRMCQTCFWWAIITAFVVLFSYFSGVLTHPLVRAKKKVARIKALCQMVESSINSNVTVDMKTRAKQLKKIKKANRSMQYALNVYIYDDESNNIQIKSSVAYINKIDSFCKDSLVALVEGNNAEIAQNMNEIIENANKLYDRLDAIKKKEEEAKILDI